MEQGGTLRGPAQVARLGGRIGRRIVRCGRCALVLAFLSGGLLAMAIITTLVGEPATTTRITVKLPCSEVDSASVGHSGYGMDEVLSTSCITPPSR